MHANGRTSGYDKWAWRAASLTILVLLAGLCTGGRLSAQERGPGAPLVAGQALARALDQPLAAEWDNVGLRTIVRRIGEARGVAVLLDRRVDPCRPLAAQSAGEPLRDFLARLAEQSGAGLCVTGSCVYIGPERAARALRTLIALREEELAAQAASVPRSRRGELVRPETLTWDDLDRPADILARCAAQRGLSVENPDLIPHDLWGAAALPAASAAEALSLVLVQWDLTFAWGARGTAIRLEPIPDEVRLQREHRPPSGLSAAEAAARWPKEFPDLEARVAGSQVAVRGTLEQHEELERQGKPGRPAGGAGTTRARPLSAERFTLRIQNAPASALLKKLEEPAYGRLTFEPDAAALREAGIDLDQRVTFEVRGATLAELLEAALGPLGLAFEITDRTVRLFPSAP